PGAGRPGAGVLGGHQQREVDEPRLGAVGRRGADQQKAGGEDEPDRGCGGEESSRHVHSPPASTASCAQDAYSRSGWPSVTRVRRDIKQAATAPSGRVDARPGDSPVAISPPRHYDVHEGRVFRGTDRGNLRVDVAGPGVASAPSARAKRQGERAMSPNGNPAAIRHGMFIMPFHDPAKSPAQCYDEDLELIVRAEELGFAEFWIGEHHTMKYENIVMP